MEDIGNYGYTLFRTIPFDSKITFRITDVNHSISESLMSNKSSLTGLIQYQR